MTPDEYRAALAALGLSQVAAGRVLGISPRTAQRFAIDGPSGPASFAVRMLMALDPKQRDEWIKVKIAH